MMRAVTVGGGVPTEPYSYPVVHFDREGQVVDTVRWETVEPSPTMRLGDTDVFTPRLMPTSPIRGTVGTDALVIRWSVAVGTTDGFVHVTRIAGAADTVYEAGVRCC